MGGCATTHSLFSDRVAIPSIEVPGLLPRAIGCCILGWTFLGAGDGLPITPVAHRIPMTIIIITSRATIPGQGLDAPGEAFPAPAGTVERGGGGAGVEPVLSVGAVGPEG